MNSDSNHINTDNNKQNSSSLLGMIMAIVSLVAILPIASLIGFVTNVQNAFVHVQPSPEAMAEVISHTMALSFWVCLYGLIGIIAIFIVLFATQYRFRALFWFWIFVSILWILSIPFGSLFGLLLLIVLIVKRKEFSPKSRFDS